jgi:hypothetical protein
MTQTATVPVLQEIEHNVVTFITALLNQQTPDLSCELGPYTAICHILAERMPQAPTAQAAQDMLKHVRKKPGNEPFDRLLKDRLDPHPEKKPHTPTPLEDDEPYIPPLPDGIITPLAIEGGIIEIMHAYIQYSEEMSPEGYSWFHEGCFWWLASTIAARRIRIDFRTDIYTSLYLALVARSSLFAKSETASVPKKVLRKLGLGYLLNPDRITPQKLLSNMGGKYADFSQYGAMNQEEQEAFHCQLAMSAQRGWMHDEFGKFIQGMMNQSSTMADFNSILLSLESSPEDYKNDTITRSLEPITKPYLTILGSATPSNFRHDGKKGDDLWLDGTHARFGFLCPPKGAERDKPFERGQIECPQIVLVTLRAWHNRLGLPHIAITPKLDKKGEPTAEYEVTQVRPLPEHSLSISDDAYDTWCRYRSALKQIIKGDESEIFDSSYQRLPIKAIKIAALAASIENAAQIEQRHILIALRFSEKLRTSLHRLYSQITGVTKQGESPEEKILKLLEKKGALTAREVSQYTHSDAQSTLSRLEALKREGEISSIKQGKKTIYSLLLEENEQV